MNKGFICFSVLLAGVMLMPVNAAAQQAPGCAALTKMRNDYRAVNTTLPNERVKKIIDEKPDFNAEEAGCFGDWGVNIGIGLSSLAGSFFDQLKDQACSAMDSYVNSQFEALTASIGAPLDRAGSAQAAAGVRGTPQRLALPSPPPRAPLPGGGGSCLCGQHRDTAQGLAQLVLLS